MARRVPPTLPTKNRPTPAQAAARKELERRQRLPRAVDALVGSMFGKQRELVLSTRKRIVTCAGRRSGKTHGLVGRAVRAASRYPGRTIPIFERTQTCSSSRVFWRALNDLNEEYSLGARFHNSLYLATFPNRAEIIIVGADTADAADKARGDAYPEAIVDEAGTFRPHILEYLLNDVLTAALFDYGGTLVMSGTPAVRPVGPFWEACESTDPKIRAAWHRIHWTLFQNPHLPKDTPDRTYAPEEREAARDKQFREELASRGWAPDSGFVQREFMGLWVADNESLAYRVPPHAWQGVTAPDDLYTHPERFTFGLGIDLGFNDPTAFVVVARRRNSDDRTLWVVESFEQAGLTPTRVCAEVARLMTRYRFAHIVADTGGYGKGPVAEMLSDRWNIPVVGANKSPGYKAAGRDVISGDLASGALRIVEASNKDLTHDLAALRLDIDGKEDERDADHLPDALLYIGLAMAAPERGLGRAVVDKPRPGTPQWLAKLEADCEEWARKQAGAPERVEDPAESMLPRY